MSPVEAGPNDELKETPLYEQDPSQFYPPVFGHLHEVGFLEISKDATVADLKEMIMTLPAV